MSGPQAPLFVPEVTVNALSANFPELMLLAALLLSVLCWRVIQMILTALALGFVLLVVVGMAGYGAFAMLLYR